MTISPLAKLFILFVRLYQVTLRPFVGGFCRFQPTCSDYSIEALRKYGAIKGGWKTVCRLLRCHPFGGCGYDPP
ncbi:MAG: membrane protein insertion efficiency factor YidD [Phycisphaerales bacterium]|nr:membrane protein insertion efficiency factor YidD [Phycisphaerales bacterium]